MTAQHDSIDPNTIQTGSESGARNVQVDGEGVFDPGLGDCSVWGLVVRRPGETEGGVDLSLDPAGVGQRDVEAVVRRMARERGEAVVVWLAYQREGEAFGYERAACWVHPSGSLVWSTDVGPGKSPARRGTDPVAVLAQLGGEDAVAVVDALLGATPPVEVPMAHPAGPDSDGLPACRVAGPFSGAARLEKRFVSVWENDRAVGDVPSLEIYASGYGRAEMLRIASRTISAMASYAASEEGGADAY